MHYSKRVLLRLTKTSSAVGEFTNVQLSDTVYNAYRACLESVQTVGATNSTILGVDLNLPSDTVTTISNAEDVQGVVVHLPSANAAAIYEHPEQRQWLLKESASQIRKIEKIKITDENIGAANRHAPDFTGLVLVLRFDCVDEGARHRNLRAADRGTSEELPGSRTRGYVYK